MGSSSRHGGSAIGYTLYLKEGRVVFAVHSSGKEITRVASPGEITAKTAIEAHLAADGAMTLALDGRQVAAGKAAGPLGHQPAEAFCVGHDDAVPVDNYDGKKLFQGTIDHLKVIAGPKE